MAWAVDHWARQLAKIENVLHREQFSANTAGWDWSVIGDRMRHEGATHICKVLMDKAFSEMLGGNCLKARLKLMGKYVKGGD